MKPKKVAVLGGAGAGPIRAAALIESIMRERENPGLLIIPHLKDLDEKSIRDMINEANMYPAPIIASFDDETI
ncbi:MAG: hypothetical protein RIC57_03410 [Balneola sp.]